MNIFRLFFNADPEAGQSGQGGGGSLINPAANPPASDDPPASASAEPAKNTDPFGDFEEYKDPDNGMYFGRYKHPAEVFKGMKEAEKELGRLKREKSPREAPEKYETVKLDGDDLPQDYRGYEVSSESDPMYKHFAPIFQELKLSQEEVSKLVKASVLFNLGQAPDLAAEKAKLGDQADAIIGAVTTYATKRGTPAAMQLAELAGSNAEALKELHILISRSGDAPIPGSPGNTASAKSWQDQQAEAWEFRQKHEAAGTFGRQQQEMYQNMMTSASRAKLATKKAGG